MKMKKPSIMLLSILLFLLSVFSITNVSGTYISLTTQISMEKIVQENETTISINLINSGDERAYDVQTSLLLPPGFEANSLFPGNLDPNVPYEGNITIKINSEVAPGAYTLGILTDYKDANGYGFSSVSPTSIFIKKQTSSQVSGKLSQVTVSSEGGEEKKLILTIRNYDTKPHYLKINLFLPRELKADSMEKEFRIGAKEERELIFKVSSFGALPGSTYGIFSTLEYEDKSLHYSSIASGIVKVVEKKDVFDLPSIPIWIPIAALIVLILIFLFYQFSMVENLLRKLKKKRKRKKEKK